MSDLAKTGFQTEHFFEVQFPKKLLQTAYTGMLPNVGLGVTKLLAAAPITEENLYAGWNKLYASSLSLNQFYEVITDVPKTYVAPLNTPADRLMTAIGDWGNMQNLLLVAGHVNWVKGKLFSLENPMAQATLKAAVTAALKGDADAAKKIEVVLQSVSWHAKPFDMYVRVLTGCLQVFAVFNYMNDAGTAVPWRTAYGQINKEIENMDEHMPELKGIKAIFDEFLPAYQDAVAEKAATFVKGVYNYILFNVPAEKAGLSDHLGKLLWTTGYYAKKASDLKWQKDFTG